VITLDALSGRLSSAGLSAVMLSERGDSRAVVVPELGAKVLGDGVDEENLGAFSDAGRRPGTSRRSSTRGGTSRLPAIHRVRAVPGLRMAAR
jgi:hypothetical protein